MTDIAALIPHGGAMCLLRDVLHWDADHVVCDAISHRSATNPLRRAGRLSALCGAEYAMQAAALHGALLDGTKPPAGRVASLRDFTLHVDRLDEPGVLIVTARLLYREVGGLLYAFDLVAAGRLLIEGRGAVSIPQ